MAPPGPVKIGHKKDGRQRRPHRFHVSRPPPLTRPLDPLLVLFWYLTCLLQPDLFLNVLLPFGMDRTLSGHTCVECEVLVSLVCMQGDLGFSVG